MADAEVSSTTPNEVHEEFGEGVMNGSNNEAEAKEENTVLVSFAAHDETELREVMKGVETHTAFEPEPAKPEPEPEPEPLVTSTMEEPQTKESKKEQEEEIVQTADKAETELPEKLDLISSSEPSEVEESEWLEEQQVAAVAAPVPVQEVKAPEKEAPTEPPAAEKEAIPEQLEPEQKEEIVAAVPEHTAVVTSTPEPEEIRASPVEVVQKQEDFAVSEPVVVKAEETFKSAPVDEEPAPAPLPPSSHEPSLPAPAAPLPPLMQFTSVVDLLYWRDVKNTGVVFGACLLLLLSLSVCSIISVLSYVALALLSVTVTFRIYKGILQAIQKSDEGHPFKQYLEQDVTLPEAVVHKYSDVALGRINSTIVELRRVFLVEDLVDSLKFAVLMWILTYVGAFFNGLTLLILGLVSAFTCPVVYEKHQNDPFLQIHLQNVHIHLQKIQNHLQNIQIQLQETQIDHYIALVNNQIKDVVGKIQAKIPGAKKKAE